AKQRKRQRRLLPCAALSFPGALAEARWALSNLAPAAFQAPSRAVRGPSRKRARHPQWHVRATAESLRPLRQPPSLRLDRKTQPLLGPSGRRVLTRNIWTLLPNRD